MDLFQSSNMTNPATLCATEPWGRYSASGDLYSVNGTQYLYSFGGDTTSDADGRGGVVRTNFRFDLNTQCWERLNNSPTEIGYRATATWLKGDSVYVLFGADRLRVATTNVYKYSLMNDTWTALETINVPPARWKHAAVALDETRILITGGRDGEVVRNDAWIFDTADLTWTMLNTTGLLAMYRHGLTFDPNRNVAWVYGGLGADLVRYDSQLWQLDMTTREVSKVNVDTTNNPLPPRLASHAMVYSPELDVLVLWGGTCSDDSELHIYDPSPNNWCRIFPENRPDRRDAMLWSLYYPYFYVATGDSICYNGQVLTLADVHVLDLQSLEHWEALYVPTNVPRGTGLEPYCNGANEGSCQPSPFLDYRGSRNSTCSADLLKRFHSGVTTADSTTTHSPTSSYSPTPSNIDASSASSMNGTVWVALLCLLAFKQVIWI